MKKKIFSIIVLFVLTISVATKTHAEDIVPPTTPEGVNINLVITTPTSSLYNQNINVTACDSDNPSTSTVKVTAYCAILQSGLSSDWNFTWAPGIFLNSISDITGFTSQDSDGNDVYHYWSWSLNSVEAQVGLNQYELQPNDIISLTFIDPVPVVPVAPTPIEEVHHGSSGSRTRIIAPIKIIFDSKKAFDFLISKQKENGSFGEDLYTDWVSIALGSMSDYPEQKTKLINYLKSVKLSNALLTDYERHAMALMSLGISPYDINGENYIKKITDSFDGKQFGNKDEINDDIFALIVLQNAGYKKEEIISNTVNFIISKQKDDGSWNNSVDMTSAGIEALVMWKEKEEVQTALKKAKEFLQRNQKDDGSFGNISSTAWAMEGILAFGESPTDWKKNDNTPLDYLAKNQDIDGGIKNENIESKIWETAYALTSLSGKTWNQIMQKFDKVILEEIQKEIAPIEKLETKKIITQNKKKNIEKLSPQNTASVIETLPQDEKQEEVKKVNYFRNFLNKILEIFF